MEKPPAAQCNLRRDRATRPMRSSWLRWKHPQLQCTENQTVQKNLIAQTRRRKPRWMRKPHLLRSNGSCFVSQLENSVAHCEMIDAAQEVSGGQKVIPNVQSAAVCAQACGLQHKTPLSLSCIFGPFASSIIFLFVSVCWWDGRSITKLPLIRTFATVTISLCVSVNWPQYHDIVICGALSRWSSPLGNVRGAFLAKGPDSSVGGVPVGYCPMKSTWKRKRYKSRFR